MNNTRYQIYSGSKKPPKLKKLPPTDANLMLHILHAHLQVMLWKAAGQREPPAEARDISKFGWEVAKEGAVMPALAIQAVAPINLLDVTSCTCSTLKACSKGNCSCHAASISCTDYCKCEGDADPCQDNKCVRGVCVPLDGYTYRCDHQQGEAPALAGGGGGALWGGAAVGRAAADGGWCQGLRCHRGQCQQTEDGVHCVCDPGYTGEHCDVESSCQGEVVRDFHRLQRGQSRCQTSKTYSWVECRGRCGRTPGGRKRQAITAPPTPSSCCAPLRMRRRRLTFECDDGTSWTQDVEKPVECGCKECM
ncbi:unnamed protein product [Arctogadus glacialis]